MTTKLMELLKEMGSRATIAVLLNKDVKASKVGKRVLVAHNFKGCEETLVQVFEMNGFNEAILIHSESLVVSKFRDTIARLEFAEVGDDFEWQHFDGGWHNTIPSF